MATLNKFKIEHGALIKVDSSSAKPTNRWKPLATKIEQFVDCGNGLVVREDYHQFPKGKSNLYKLSYDFELMWTAELPSTTDTFPNLIVYDGKSLKCASWEGETCTFDLVTGKIISREFSK